MDDTITIVGAGYVGLTTAAVLANSGFKVFVLDVDKKKIDTIKQGKSHFFEVGLDGFISKAINNNTLRPTTIYEECIPLSSIIFSCVGTPDKVDGSLNLDYVFEAAENVFTHAKEGLVFVQKSTVPVGTGKKIIKLIDSLKTEFRFSYVSSPEFLAEGSALLDTLNIDRVVVGGDDQEALNRVIEIFRSVDTYAKELDLSDFAEYATTYKKRIDSHRMVNFDNKIIKSTLESAELIKITSNAFLALKISFANSIAKLCDNTNADINQVMDGAGADPRIGRSFLYSGLGWGGSCFPKDVNGLISIQHENNVDSSLMNSVVAENNSMIEYVIYKLKKYLEEDLTNKNISVLGLSFKPGTSDIRKSQAIKLINKLVENGCKVSTFDPKSIEEAKKELQHPLISYCESIDECLKDSDAVIIATEWGDFLNYDWKKGKTLMKGTFIIDARNRLNKEKLKSIGFIYEGIGQR